MVENNIEQGPGIDTRVKREVTSYLNPHVPPFQTNSPLQENSAARIKSENVNPSFYQTNNSQMSRSQPQISGIQLGETTLQEMVKLQIKQTELSAMIADQQRIQSLPIQEPPSFDGSLFDYPIFTRAFETIIESRVLGDNERLYFLNKHTTGKANDIIKAFVTLKTEDGYQLSRSKETPGTEIWRPSSRV